MNGAPASGLNNFSEMAGAVNQMNPRGATTGNVAPMGQARHGSVAEPPPQTRDAEGQLAGEPRLTTRRRRFASGGNDARDDERRMVENLYAQVRRRKRLERLRPQESQAMRDTAAQEKTEREQAVEAVCNLMEQKLNSQRLLQPFLSMTIKTNTVPTYDVGKKKLPSSRLISVRDPDDKSDRNPGRLSLEFKFEVAPLGTFQTIEPDGSLPDPDLHLNPVSENLSQHIGEHLVKVDTEIPAPKLKLSALTIHILPTHQMQCGSLFLSRGHEGATTWLAEVYYLPPGYYRLHEVSLDYIHNDLLKDYSFTSSSGQLWSAYKNRSEAWFFYNGALYLLPAGYILSPMPPKLELMVGIYAQLSQTSSYNHIPIDQNVWHSKLGFGQQGDASSSVKKILNTPQMALVARYHGNRLEKLDYHFITYFLCYCLGKIQAAGYPILGTDDSYIQLMEIMAHRLQMIQNGVYYGPAPPFKVLQKLFKTEKSRAHLEVFMSRGVRRGKTKTRPPVSPLSLPPPVEEEKEENKEQNLAENIPTFEND